jgi:hypothetical protein
VLGAGWTGLGVVAYLGLNRYRSPASGAPGSTDTDTTPDAED